MSRPIARERERKEEKSIESNEDEMRVNGEQANQIRLVCLPYWYHTPVRKYSSISYHRHNNHSPIDDLPSILSVSSLLSRLFFYCLTSMMTLRLSSNVRILAIGWHIDGEKKKRMKDVEDTLVKTIYTAKQYNLFAIVFLPFMLLHLRALLGVYAKKKKGISLYGLRLLAFYPALLLLLLLSYRPFADMGFLLLLLLSF